MTKAKGSRPVLRRGHTWRRGYFLAMVLFAIICARGALACEVTDVWLYVADSEAEVRNQNRFKLFLCNPNTPYWFRLKWKHKEGPGGFGNDFPFHVSVYDHSISDDIWEDNYYPDNDEPDKYVLQEVREVTDASYLAQGVHQLEGWARRWDVGDWVNSPQATVAINADPGVSSVGWLPIALTDECPPPGGCPPTTLNAYTKTDDCGNTVTVDCVPLAVGCCFELRYNGATVGFCPWREAANGFESRRTVPLGWGNCRHLETKHCSFNDSHNPPLRGPDPQGEAHTGMYCWRVERHDCINNVSYGHWWRKTTSSAWYPGCAWDETNGSCCDGLQNNHPMYDGSCP